MPRSRLTPSLGGNNTGARPAAEGRLSLSLSLFLLSQGWKIGEPPPTPCICDPPYCMDSLVKRSRRGKLDVVRYKHGRQMGHYIAQTPSTRQNSNTKGAIQLLPQGSPLAARLEKNFINFIIDQRITKSCAADYRAGGRISMKLEAPAARLAWKTKG